jgi:hypothetical protein
MHSPKLRSLLSLAFLLSFALVTVGVRPAFAEDKEIAELEHYTLTMDKITRYMHVLEQGAEYVKAHPDQKADLQAALETDADKHESTDQIARRMAANPVAAELFAKNGWSAHEFVVCEFAYLQTAMAVGMKPADKTDAQWATETHVNPANIAFVRAHQAEIQTMMQAMQKRYGE